MRQKYRDRDPSTGDKFLKESSDSWRDYTYHRTNDYDSHLNKNTHNSGYISSDKSLRSPRHNGGSRSSAFGRDSSEYLDRRKEYSKTSFKGSSSRNFEHFRSSRHDLGASPRERSSRFTSRSPSPHSENQKFRNSSDSRYYSSLPHSFADSTYKALKEKTSYGSSNAYKGESSSYRQLSVDSGENFTGSSQQSRLHKIPTNTYALEISARIFTSPVEEQEKEFLRLNRELALLDEKSKGVLKEKRLSMFEWQKLVYKSEREAKNVELAEKQLEAVVNEGM
ncbi:uncharacterized protein T551_02186 [Pneumocystis jirovecii RU7]|uniref:Uncharacterized protein n=1 Tax=Pneumocystis jirovecii (strain RU7) TaxID=1408657 RepID=A0A0W4ZMG8_PNEJ7|nr:uncharacterized protein T551_02186 [Pneumocystis jirovecii RU7]KTW29570.1 hypothetical protein T551_02186 [Pneumocystis jirovecii RU7]